MIFSVGFLKIKFKLGMHHYCLTLTNYDTLYTIPLSFK